MPKEYEAHRDRLKKQGMSDKRAKEMASRAYIKKHGKKGATALKAYD